MKTKTLRVSVMLLLFTLLSGVKPFVYAQSSDPITSSRCNVFSFDATGSYDPDNQELTFHWDFGDGHSSVDPVVKHVYESSGTYKVALTVRDHTGAQCNSALANQKVLVHLPPFASFAAPSRVCTEDEVYFDASASVDKEGGRPLSYQWDFGNGESSTEKKSTQRYQRGGVYDVALTVDDGSGQMCSKSTLRRPVYVNEAPKVDAGPDVFTRCILSKDDLAVEFDGSKTTDINNDELQYQWDFGDGAVKSGMQVKHIFRKAGVYDVSLTVDDGSQLACSQAVDYIRVRLDSEPIAKATEEIVGCVSEDVVLDGSRSLSDIKGTLNAKWDFGDGSSEEGIKVAHRYKKPGKYRAKLKIENALNEKCPSSSDITNVIINGAPSVTLKEVEAICLGETVYFDASSALDPDKDKLEFYWNFGDGHIITGGPKVHHVYSQGGEFRVSVIVDDGRATSCSTATAYARVKVNAPPIANPGPNLACCVGKSTDFTGRSSYDPDEDELSFTWDFGDGQQAEGAQTSHTYKKAGEYTVGLVVDDGSQTLCSSAKAEFTAVVNTQPVAVMEIK